MKKKSIALYVLLFLLGFLSVGAIFGGGAMILAPSGEILQIPVSMIENTAFKNFLIAGIILLVVFGIFPAFTIYALIKRPVLRWAERFNILKDMYWAWTYALYIGFGQIIWISIQTFIINQVGIVHIIYTLLGISIVSVALLTPVRLSFSKLNS